MPKLFYFFPWNLQHMIANSAKTETLKEIDKLIKTDPPKNIMISQGTREAQGLEAFCKV